MQKIKILVADDHPFIRMGIINELKKNKSLQVIAEVNSGKEALESILSFNPDVAVLDIDMPGISGLEVCEELKSLKHYSTQIVMLTMYKEYELYERALELGVKAYVLKDNAATELTEAIFNANEGLFYTSKNLDHSLIKKKSLYLHDRKLINLIKSLTNSEKSILILVSKHKTTKEIASLVFVSEKTVENHRHNICKKLQLDNTKNSLLLFALKHKDLLEHI